VPDAVPGKADQPEHCWRWSILHATGSSSGFIPFKPCHFALNGFPVIVRPENDSRLLACQFSHAANRLVAFPALAQERQDFFLRMITQGNKGGEGLGIVMFSLTRSILANGLNRNGSGRIID
jgi:hypothetical protein